MCVAFSFYELALCVGFTLYHEEREILKKIDIWEETEEKSGSNGLADGRIVRIKATCNNKWRWKNWWTNIELWLVFLKKVFTQYFGFV